MMATHQLDKKDLEEKDPDRSPPETQDLENGQDHSYVRYMEAWPEDEDLKSVWTLSDRRPEPDESD